MVAKSFQKFECVGEPFKENGKMYVNLSNGRKVRWYTEAEYLKLYPEDKEAAAANLDNKFNFRKTLGFGERGFIYIFQGDTYAHKDELYLAKARYHNYWGWYIIEGIECPQIEGLTPVKLEYDKISINDYQLKPENTIREYVDSLIYPDTDTEYNGNIGDRLEIEVEVIKAVQLENQFGITTIHTMKDWDGHLYNWTTSAKQWPSGSFHKIRGTVKEYKKYHGDKITVLTRCSEV